MQQSHRMHKTISRFVPAIQQNHQVVQEQEPCRAWGTRRLFRFGSFPSPGFASNEPSHVLPGGASSARHCINSNAAYITEQCSGTKTTTAGFPANGRSANASTHSTFGSPRPAAMIVQDRYFGYSSLGVVGQLLLASSCSSNSTVGCGRVVKASAC